MTNHKIKRALYIGALLIFALTILSAQNSGKISGLVKDAETGEPLIGVNVVVLGTSLGNPSDIDGNYFILNVPVGKYEVQASMVGYAKVTKTDVVVNLGKTTSIDFALSPLAVLQKEVIVEAIRPDVEREKTSTSMITRSDEVRQLPAMHNVNDVLNLSSDVQDNHFRGGRSGEVLYTLQGVGTTNPYDNSTTIDPIMSAVEEVEVVTSGMGAQYGSAQSGVVNISMKEGKSDKWKTFVDFHATVPQKKHFGPSPWDASANPYLQKLNDINNYNLVGDPNHIVPDRYAGPGQQGAGFLRLFNDSLMCRQVGFALQQQALNHQNRSYGNKPDYTAELSTGGPLSESSRMFFAANTKVSWPVLATEHPDESYQLLGNLVNDVGSGATVRVSASFSQNNSNLMSNGTNAFPNNNTDYFTYLYNMLTGTTYRQQQNEQVGLRFTKALSPYTFYEIKLSGLATLDKIGSRTCLPDSIVAGTGFNVYWTGRPFATLQGYSAIPASTFRDDKTQTVSLDASLTSQVAKAHLINAGVQANMFFLDINDQTGGTYVTASASSAVYKAHPIEASLYIQDKMEFEGMVANVGLRLDAWNNRGSYGNLDSVYTKNFEAPILGRLQPRAGFSFPISLNTVFHVNYGMFIQKPQLQYSTYEQVNQTNLLFVPNPNLKPQTTNSYDIGLTQALAEGFTLDVSGYYKNQTDLIRRVQYNISGFTPSGQGGSYQSYVNYDYADIRGFHISLTKRTGNLTGAINYTYSVNTGSSASATTTNLIYTYLSNGRVITLNDNTTSMPSQEVLLDYDRTHNLVVNLGYLTEENFGPEIGKTHPLGDIAIALSSSAVSGRPYTYKPYSSSGEWMNMRSPAEYNTDVKISKRIKDFYGTVLTVYAEVFNVFDNKVLNYNYLFQASLTSDKNSIIQRYLATDDWGSQDGLLYYSQNNQYLRGFGVDQSYFIWSNQPRSYWFGISVEF
jgi:outer membrane receptor protein involved in Fe transport